MFFEFTDIQNEIKVMLKAGTRMTPVTITKEGGRLFFKFGFNKPLMEELKQMEGSKYHGFDEKNPRKVWSIVDSQRNQFQLQYLVAPAKDDPNNPYYLYDIPLIQINPRRELKLHQVDLFRHGYTRHYCLFAAEMGTGKTLVAIEVMEAALSLGVEDWLWVGPKSALVSVRMEFIKWKCPIQPRFITYEGLKKLLEEWPEGKKPPNVVFDESSRLKNHTAQRTQAARHLANSIREIHGQKGFVIEMSGSPAPKDPTDWWSQSEIACPGFLKEGTVEKLKRTLAVIEMKESFDGGGAFPTTKTWRDDENKCNKCGLLKEDETHSPAQEFDVTQELPTNHIFEPSVNEIARLYRRLTGLVMVKFKKDCLDLPDKIYREIVCKPTQSILNAAKAIAAKSTTSIGALTLLRELSDGFQYVEVNNGTVPCDRCLGAKRVIELFDKNNPEERPNEDEVQKGYRLIYDEDADLYRPGAKIEMAEVEVDCPRCGATGEMDSRTREAKQIPCPKEAALRDLLEEHADVGRIVIYGGFTGSLDRITSIVNSVGWKYIRVDGRGWFSNLLATKAESMMEAFQTGQDKYSKVAFIGQPGAAGMGLTLTASPSIVYYSNDFNAESRIQSEDRIHRIGMDSNRGATIIDLLHLPSDLLILNNLKKKRKLQEMSMGEMAVILNQAEEYIHNNSRDVS